MTLAGVLVTLTGGPVTLAGGPVTLAAEPITQITDSGPQAHFEAAVFPRVVQLQTSLDPAPAESGSSAADRVPPLLLTHQQDPVRVLPLANSRPVVSSLERIQAAAAVETNVRLRPAALSGTVRGAALDKPPVVAEASAATMTNSTAAVEARPDRKSIATTEAGTKIKRAVERPSPALASDGSDATQFLLKSRQRSEATDEKAVTADGRAYLNGVLTIVFSAAAVAAALVLPGILSEIRRRRKRALPQIARAPQPGSESDREQTDRERASYPIPIRERAG